MRLLPKQQIDKERNDERKKDIDYGVTLAKKIDALRETKFEEEKALSDWRAIAVKGVQDEIDSLTEDRDNLFKDNTEARRIREELLKPLDAEWIEIHDAKKRNDEVKRTLAGYMQSVQDTERELQLKVQEVRDITEKLSKREKDITDKEKSITPLHTLAEKRIVDLQLLQDKYSSEHEQSLKDIAQIKTQYENGIKVYEIHEKELNEKEADLIIREQHLASQQETLKTALASKKQK